MCVYIYIYIYRERERYAYVHIHIHLSLPLSLSIYIYTHMYAYIHIYIYIYIYITLLYLVPPRRRRTRWRTCRSERASVHTGRPGPTRGSIRASVVKMRISQTRECGRPPGHTRDVQEGPCGRAKRHVCISRLCNMLSSNMP